MWSLIETNHLLKSQDLTKKPYIRIHKKLANLNPNQTKIFQPILCGTLTFSELRGREKERIDLGIITPNIDTQED